MPRGFSLALMVLAAWGCEGSPHQASWTIRFAEPGLDERAVAIEARIERGGCGSGIEVYRADVVPGEAARMPPRLDPGVYGFAARARDASCTFFAAGCTERRLPTDDPEIVVVLTRIAEEPACLSDGGVDSGMDAGSLDAGSADASAADAGGVDGGRTGDGGPPDAGPPDAGPLDAGPDLLTGLVARWECEDDPRDGQVDDLSGNGNHARCEPAAPGSTTDCPARAASAGRPGMVCVFGAPRFMHADDVPGFRAPQFTIALWLAARSLDGAVFGKPVGSGSSNSWQFEIQDPHAVFTTGIAPDTRLFLASSEVLTEGRWHHIAATYDGVRKRLYQDGRLVATQDAPVGYDMHDVIIGADDNGGSIVLHFPGSLDDIRVYDRVLTDGQIAALAGL